MYEKIGDKRQAHSGTSAFFEGFSSPGTLTFFKSASGSVMLMRYSARSSSLTELSGKAAVVTASVEPSGDSEIGAASRSSPEENRLLYTTTGEMIALPPLARGISAIENIRAF